MKIDSKKLITPSSNTANRTSNQALYTKQYKTTQPRTTMSSMNDIIKAVQKHEIEVASQSIDKLVEEIHRVLTDKDADLLESLEEYLSDIVSTVKDTIKEESKKAAKVATGKKVKDPNAPKRTPSEYNNFIKDNIASLRGDHPEAKPKELMSMAVDAWRIHKEKIGSAKPMDGAKLLSDTEDSDVDTVGHSTASKKKVAAGKKNGKK